MMKRKYRVAKRKSIKKNKSHYPKSLFLLLGAVILIGIPYLVIKSIFAQTPDTSSPTKSVVRPDPADVITGNTMIEVDVTDPSGVAKVELRFRDRNDPNVRGTEYVFIDTEAPYQFPWDTKNLPDGKQAYDIQAWDTLGNGDNEFLAASFFAMNDPNHPSIKINTPASSSTMQVEASANKGVKRVEIFEVLAGKPINKQIDYDSPYEFQYNGAYSGEQFIVRAFENTTEDPGQIIFPKIFFLSPINGSTVPKGKKIAINNSATDDIGVVKVETYVDSVLLCTDNIAPYECAWTVGKQPKIRYALKSIAYDALGGFAATTAIVTSK